jgi:kynurenine formamidase
MRIEDLLAQAEVHDLGQPYYPGMPHHPTHPPFLFGMVKGHGEYAGPAGHSSAADAMALGTHTGTHMDALCHFSLAGHLHGGGNATGQAPATGMASLAIDTVAPVVRRGVLLDIAAAEGVSALPEDFEIEPAHLDAAARGAGVQVRPGDVVLLRTGWAAYWDDAARFVNQVRGPGPSLAGARWLSGHGVFAAGSDTVAFERVPSPEMPVHVHLLVESGIHIIECLNLETLAAVRVPEFLFAASPLKIRGATGAPVRPLAIVFRE